MNPKYGASNAINNPLQNKVSANGPNSVNGASLHKIATKPSGKETGQSKKSGRKPTPADKKVKDP